jgi:hypothetical protein
MQARELLQVFDAFRELNNVYTLNVFACDDAPERAYRELRAEVASFKLPRSEHDLQEVSPGSLQKSHWREPISCGESFTLTLKRIYLRPEGVSIILFT